MFKQILKQKLFRFSRRHISGLFLRHWKLVVRLSSDRRSHTNQFNDALAQFQFETESESEFEFSSIGVSFTSVGTRLGGVDDLSSSALQVGLPVVASLLSIIISIRNEAKATKAKLIFSSFRCRRCLKAKVMAMAGAAHRLDSTPWSADYIYLRAPFEPAAT